MFNKDSEDMFWSTETDRKNNVVWKSFKRYDLDKKTKEFNPKSTGAAFANSHEEVKDSKVLVQKEIQYISDINSFIDELQEWFEKGIGSIKKTIESYSRNRDMQSSLEEIKNKFSHDADRQLLNFKNDQEFEIARRRETTYAYSHFKYQHIRITDAIYPDSKIFVLSLVIGAIVIEGLLNAFFFKEASSLGLLGGFLAAAFASVVNVGWSFIMGWAFLRMIHQTEVDKPIKQLFFRVSGGVLFVISIGLIAALHLTIAHFRELANKASDTDLEVFHAFRNMLNDPFNINEMQSLLLIIIGTLIAIISIVEGYKFSDPHIGYEGVHRRMVLAEENLRDEKSEYRNNIANLYEGSVIEVDDKFKTIEAQIANLQEIRPEVDAFFGCIDSYYEHTRTAAHSLISAFREGFNAVRLDDPLPYSKELVENNVDDINIEERRNDILKLIDERVSELKTVLKDSGKKKERNVISLKKIRDVHMTDNSIDKMLAKVKEIDVERAKGDAKLMAEIEAGLEKKNEKKT